MRAKKENKVYTIDPTMKNDYISRGFDIIDDDGSIIEYGSGKSVSYKEYIVLKEENKKLKEENEILKAKLLAIDIEDKEEVKTKGKGK